MYWKQELRARGKDLKKRKELKAKEELQTHGEQMQKHDFFRSLFKLGLKNLQEIELQNALASGVIDDESGEAEQSLASAARNPMISRRKSVDLGQSMRRVF